jgi:hypothetical protein
VGFSNLSLQAYRPSDQPNRHRARRRRGPDKLSAIEPLGIELQTDPVVPEVFGEIAAASAENVEIARMSVAFSIALEP